MSAIATLFLFPVLVLLTPDPTLTIDPVPPTQGGTCTVTYDGPQPATAKIHWTHADGSRTTSNITFDADGKATVTVPATAESMRVVDDQGLADAAVTGIIP